MRFGALRSIFRRTLVMCRPNWVIAEPGGFLQKDRSRRNGMSNAMLRAQSAISCFSHVRSAAFDPAGLKLAEGLLALAQAIEGLAAEQDDILSRLRQISA